MVWKQTDGVIAFIFFGGVGGRLGQRILLTYHALGDTGNLGHNPQEPAIRLEGESYQLALDRARSRPVGGGRDTPRGFSSMRAGLRWNWSQKPSGDAGQWGGQDSLHKNWIVLQPYAGLAHRICLSKASRSEPASPLGFQHLRDIETAYRTTNGLPAARLRAKQCILLTGLRTSSP